MNVSQIAAFHAVMTSASLSDAARKLGRTQPAVSAAIKNLEDQFGLRLFQREGRKLVPLPEAHYLHAEAEAILTRLSRVKHTMRSLVDGRSGKLNVAAMPGPVSMLFPKFLADRLDTGNDVSVSILARTSNQIAELARAQSIDFGFADAPETKDAENLYHTEVISAEVMLALPADHPLAKLDRVSVTDLNAVPMGTLPATHAHQTELLATFEEKGVVFRKTVESQTFLPILHFVAAGQCCSVVDPLTVLLVKGEGAMVDGIEIRPMVEKLRYRYAIFSPRYRPASLLADETRVAWRDAVLQQLQDLQADPKTEEVIHEGADKSFS